MMEVSAHAASALWQEVSRIAGAKPRSLMQQHRCERKVVNLGNLERGTDYAYELI